MNKKLRLLFSLLLAGFTAAFAIEGYYKDVFVDAGIGFDGSANLPGIDYVGFTRERMDISVDTLLQTRVLFHNQDDDNGVLLYPDGQPRFAIIYYHGGGGHKNSLAPGGAEIIKAHYFNGGSQFGTCGGSYFLARFGIRLWEGRIISANGPYNMRPGKSTHFLPPDSPLRDYYDFGPDFLIDSVHHNGGGSVIIKPVPEEFALAPTGTVILAIHHAVFPKISGQGSGMAGQGAIWGWKDHDTTGRLVGITSHPEASRKEDQKREMGAILRYLKDGLGTPRIKHRLTNNTTIRMNAATADKNPAFTKIGDKQYHHFTVPLPKGARNLRITLDAEEGFDMHLFARKDTFAFADSAEYADTMTGCDKELMMPEMPAGTWYIGVKCATTVTSQKKTVGEDYFEEYTGKTEVLNGVAYSIKAEWNDAGVHTTKTRKPASSDGVTISCKGAGVNFTPRNGTRGILKIFDARGRLCHAAFISGTTYHWEPRTSGIYTVYLKSGEGAMTKRLNLMVAED